MKCKEYPGIGEKVFSEKLENGLSVFVIPKPGFNMKYAFFATDYGGADRRFRLAGKWIDTPEGVAHFLEHKMFDTKDGDALMKLSANGASPNAFTSSDITAYHFICTDRFEENLRTLLSFVSVPYFTKASVDKEQGIIGQEIRMTEDDPDFAIYYLLLKSLFRSNPIRDSVAGTVESIAEITADTLYDCHKVFYNPSNMALCVAGDVDPEAVVKTAREVLPKEAGEVPERDYGPEESDYPVSMKAERIMEVGMPMFLTGSKLRLPGSGKEILRQELVASLALEILMGRSSKLYAGLYSEGLINSGFTAEYESAAGAAYLLCGGESNDPGAVKREIELASGEVANRGIEESVFQRFKKAAAGKMLRELNSFESICYGMASGSFRGYDFYEAPGILDGITSGDVTSFICENITPEKLAIAIIRNK